jgi:hypothetical protein
MKHVIKLIFIISCFFVSCSEDNFGVNNTNYPFKERVGFSANDILSKEIFTDIFIEILYVEGYQPTEESLNNLKIFIENRTYKSNIVIHKKLIEIGLKATYSIDDIREIENKNRSSFTSEKEIVITGLFLNGSSPTNSDEGVVYGTAFRNTSFVIFEETIHKATGSPLKPSRIALESTTILHEFCHLFGLVNIGTIMLNKHQDIENGSHCIIEDCLMYYKTENSGRIIDFVGENQIPQLDSFCIEDLQQNGGK